MSRLLRPPAASSATSRSRPVNGSTPPPRASGGVRSPPARVGEVGRPLASAAAAGRARPAPRCTSASSAAASAAKTERRRAPRSGRRRRRAASTSRSTAARAWAAWARTSGPSTTSAQLARAGRRASSGTPRRTRSWSNAGLEDVHAVAAAPARRPRGCGGAAATRSPRQASSQARVRSRVAERGGDRAVADGVGSAQAAAAGLALAEQQVALGDADVRPHERGVLAGRAAPPRRRPGTGGSPPRPGRCRGRSRRAPSRTTPTRPSRSSPRPLGGRFEQLRGPAA